MIISEKDFVVGGFRTDVKRRLKHNKNAIILIVGETGSGKSYSALSVAESLDKDFTVDRCVFRATDFMNLINKAKLKKGNVILWDEVGIEMDARNFWSISNKLISYTLESFRYMNLVLILTVPSLSFVDSKLRKLVHYLVETKRVDIKNERVMVKVFKIEHSPRSQSGKVYQKYIRYKGQRLTKTFIGKPSEEMIKDYEKKKGKFLKAMYNSIHSEIKMIDQKEASKSLDLDRVFDKVMKNHKKYTKIWRKNKIIDSVKIAIDFKVGRSKAFSVKKRVESALRY